MGCSDEEMGMRIEKERGEVQRNEREGGGGGREGLLFSYQCSVEQN